jgi:Family of unknown function (DUF6603)
LSNAFAGALRDGIVRLLSPLTAASTPAGARALLASVGRTGAVADDPGLSAELVLLANLAAGLEGLSAAELESWSGIERLVSLARDAVAAVRGVEAAVSDPAIGAEAAALGTDLAERLVAIYLRADHPMLFDTAAVLGFIEPAQHEPLQLGTDGSITRLGWPRDVLAVARIADLVRDPGDYFMVRFIPGGMQQPADAHAGAQVLFPLLATLGDTLGLRVVADVERLVPVTEPDGDFDPEQIDELIGWPPPVDESPAEPLPPFDLAGYQAGHRPRLSFELAPTAAGAMAPIGLRVTASSAAHPGGVAGHMVDLVSGGALTEERGGWRIALSGKGSLPAFTLGPNGFEAGGTSTGEVSITVERIAEPGAPAIVVGDVDGSRLEVGTFRVSSRVITGSDRTAAEVGIEATSAALVLAADDDGLLASVLPAGGLRLPFDFGVLLASDTGLRFHGGQGLRLPIPAQVSVGPVTLTQVTLTLAADGGAVHLDAASTLSTSIGPLDAVVEGLGLRLTAAEAAAGSLGPLDLDAAVRPPTGVGVALDTGPLRGGGYIEHDPATRRFSGALEFRAGDVGIDALGILDSHLPGGGYALLVSLRAEFPAVQIGLGFALTGVGGLIALNRRIDVDGLRARFADGSIGRILRPEDPVRNAPALIAELDLAFPVHRGSTVIGPTVRATWAGLVDFDIGVFLELPGPSRAVVLGSARADIVHEDRTYLALRVDVLGVIDFTAKTVSFDAVLVDSHLLGTLDLTGGAAFRLALGGSPYAVFTVGGFHPGYHPEPLVFPPTLTRVAMVHGKPNDTVYLRLEGYFAVTTNTLQFGAAAELRISFGDWSIKGETGFDALIQFIPFHFEVDIRASVHVAYRGRNLAGLTLTGSLSGPGPVLLRAKVCIDLWLFDICFAHTFELGFGGLLPLPVVADLLEAMVAAIGPDQLHGGATDPLVRLRTTPASLGQPVLAPVGAIVWEQHLAPFDLAVSRVAGGRLPVETVVRAESSVTASIEQDYFAPGQYLDLSDDEKLTRPTYERFGGGLRWGDAAPIDGASAQVPVTVREIRLPASRRELVLEAFPLWLVDATAAPVAPAITIRPESWSVLTSSGVTSGLSITAARTMVAREPGATAFAGDGTISAMVF